MTADFKQSDKLKKHGNLQHGFFTKLGGVSSGIYDSLNCGASSNDDSVNVIENRRRVMAALDLGSAKLYGVHQIHSTKVFQVSSSMDENEFPQGDALVTSEKNVALSVLGADCTPILFSSTSGVIGAAHAGWKGAVTGIVESVVKKMCELGAKRSDITACIGPTIHQPSYEVREDFIQQLKDLSQAPSERFLLKEEGRYYFDLPGYLLEECNRSGIVSETLGLDTYVLKDEFFSYRRNTHKGLKDYGRQISVVALI